MTVGLDPSLKEARVVYRFVDNAKLDANGTSFHLFDLQQVSPAVTWNCLVQTRVRTHPDTQLGQLNTFRTLNGITKKVDSLRRHHRPKPNTTGEFIDIQRLGNALATLHHDRRAKS